MIPRRMVTHLLVVYKFALFFKGVNPVNPMTEYIVTRWYRSPELLIAPKHIYDSKIDLWSVGNIPHDFYIET